MNAVASISRTDTLFIGHISWRYYNKIKKKAMEQEFSWSGFLLSMSIAFFIVAGGAFSLNLLHTSIQKSRILNQHNNIYILENSSENYLQVDLLSEKLDNLRSFARNA
ncbi:hypothetical protein A2303_07330 [Candidatus Falkowbacteria bacterium RIFOXYB2_FULL_47_14]|uniref:Uncharacterized protein n=1 Tax=Candidatus Falkowbacteria bacterium RIFOXYA2_FULL_47_19 TaxID=1797994 RepID=A0A1F5SGD0_9BACT|nr:MAG: hypothetical protein A2227_01080 [Candidatus Falkowbacteria bacterium RIFOXYA2_FULL_47_19]OGF34958.1 MAG: hypothetical protein A2468_07035 [Candidatus Falkowbacteria bacterium RIFOXYC2_FULL_46_15]OGF43673.1 MAG: hypothetical protein A2303_07330 [Candidatus Falkowbacteria bacterium RIFOXYB2_FULL_47_14]